MDDLKGKLVLITGAAGSIGSAMARDFAAEGANLALTDINQTALDKISNELKDKTGVLALAGDLAKESDMAAVAEAARSRFGGIDVLINNAAVSVYAPVWEVPTDLVWWMYEVNVLGTIHTLRQVVPAMLARGTPAHIVNIASMAGIVGGPTLGGYSASKHAVVGLTDSLRQDLQQIDAKIGVSLIAPGAVKTGGVEAMRGRIKKVADAAIREKMLAILDQTELLVQNGMEPEDVAKEVVLAVKHNLFWVTCPPAFAGALGARAQAASEDSAKMTEKLQG